MKKRMLILSLFVLLAVLALGCVCTSAHAATTASLNNYVRYDLGVTTISWSVSGGEASPYKIVLQVINNGPSAQTRWNLGTTNSHSFQTTECIPGKSYRISLYGSDGSKLDEKDYTMDYPVTFEDGRLKASSVKISIENRKMKPGSDPKKISALRASEIMAGLDDKSAYYGVKYQMKMPQLAKGRSFFVTLAFESPDGYLYVERATEITFDRVSNGYQTLWWKLAGNNFFDALYDQTGTIPRGTYTIYLYWDGMWVNTINFKVT